MVMGFFMDVVFEKTIEKKISMNVDARVSLPSSSTTATQGIDNISR
jgi:hypothetical protein